MMLAAWMLCLIPAADPLVAAQPAVDAGQVYVGQQLVRHFSIRNAGHEPLSITDLRASCGCAAPEIDRRTLQVGESARINLEVNTLSQPAGPIRWTVSVGWRAGVNEGRTTLEVTATLIREIELQPAAVTMIAKPGFYHDIVLTDRRPKPLVVRAAHIDTDHLRAELLPVNSSETRIIRVHVAESCPPGTSAEMLRIATDDPKYPELRVPITVTRKSVTRVTTVPEQPVVTPNGSVLVQLRGRESETVRIDRIEASHSALTARWAAGPGGFATLRITLNKSKWDGQSMAAEVRVALQSPIGESITIPVQIRSED